MPREESCKNRNNVIVSFKVDEETANLLKALPNRSEFIREAIRAKMAVPCPACGGSGQMTRTQAMDLKNLIESHYVGRCIHCGARVTDVTCKSSDNEISEKEHIRINQAVSGGPLYCRDCFSEARLCKHCQTWWYPGEEEHESIMRVRNQNST